jgi:hypothetical protein
MLSTISTAASKHGPVDSIEAEEISPRSKDNEIASFTAADMPKSSALIMHLPVIMDFRLSPGAKPGGRV